MSKTTWWCSGCDAERGESPDGNCPRCREPLIRLVECRGCSTVAGADRAVYHGEPVCPEDGVTVPAT